MAKYRVSYSGFAFVEADNIEEAKEIFWAGDSDYTEEEVTEVEEVDEFQVVIQ